MEHKKAGYSTRSDFYKGGHVRAASEVPSMAHH